MFVTKLLIKKNIFLLLVCLIIIFELIYCKIYAKMLCDGFLFKNIMYVINSLILLTLDKK